MKFIARLMSQREGRESQREIVVEAGHWPVALVLAEEACGRNERLISLSEAGYH